SIARGDAEVPSPASGVLTKILVGPDETVPTGAVRGEIEVNGAAPTAGNGGAPEAAAQAADYAADESAVEEAEHGPAAEVEHMEAAERAAERGPAPAAEAAGAGDL